MSDSTSETLALIAAKSDLQLGYGTGGASVGTAVVPPSTVATEARSLTHFIEDDHLAVLTVGGGDRLILGPVAVDWQAITLADANWTIVRPAEWRREGSRIWVRGLIQRTTSIVGATNAVWYIGAGVNPPLPTVTIEVPMFKNTGTQVIDNGWTINPPTPGWVGTGAGTIAVSDYVYLDNLCWPLG